MSRGFFGSLFDFNGDGKLDFSEQFMEFMAFQEIMGNNMDDKQDTPRFVGLSCTADEQDELESVGLSYDELLLMDEDERRDVLEDAGLDPDDFFF